MLLKNFIIIATLTALTGCGGASAKPDKKADYSHSTESEKIAAVEKSGYNINYINNPSKAVQVAAVQEFWGVIEDIKDPCEEAQMAAIEEVNMALKYIKNPTEKVQITAIKQNIWALKYIKNPTEKVQIIALSQDNPVSSVIQIIKNPSEKVQLVAVQQDPQAIQFLKNPSEKVQLIAIEKSKGEFGAIKYINNPTMKVQLLALGKVTIPFHKPNYTTSNKDINIEVSKGETKIINNTNQFIKVISLAEYTGSHIESIPSFSIPPQGIKTIYSTISNNIEIHSLNEQVTFGYAIEYQVGNSSPQNLYKTYKYSIDEIK